MSRRPLLWCSAAFAAGIVSPLPFDPGSAAALALVLLIGSLALLRAGAGHASDRVVAAFLLLGFGATGCLGAAAARASTPDAIDRLVWQHEDAFRSGVELTGRLARAIRTRDDPPRRELRIDVAEVKVGRHRIPATGRVLVFAPFDGVPQGIGRGDRVVLFSTLRLPAASRTAGARDARRHMLARGIRATGWLKSWDLFAKRRTARCLRARLLRWIDALREALLETLARSFAEDASGLRAAGVCMAMLVGERVLGPEEEEALARAGLNHLLAVSGFNVCLLAAAGVIVLRCAGAGIRWAWIGTMPLLVTYLLLNSEESSVLRAVVMAGALLAGRAFWRRADMLNALGGAAIVVLALSPHQIGEPGFHLTFAATLALLAAGRGGAWLMEVRARWRWVLAGALGTLAATIATTPLVALHFHRVAPAAIPANLAAGPMMAAAFVLSLALLAAACVCPILAPLLAQRIIAPLIDAVFWIAHGIVAVPGMSWRVPAPGPVAIVAYFVALAAAVWLLHRGGSRLWSSAVALAWVAALLGVIVPRDTRPVPAGLAITMLDVGQGDSVLVETPGGERILVDAGGSAGGTFDTGERVVSPSLWGMGILKLDVVVVTHADHDHAAGMAAVIRNFRPHEMWLAEPANPAEVIRSLVRQADALGIRVHEVGAGDAHCRRGARIAILSAGEAPGSGRNESSIVMKVASRGRSALLMGDAGRDVETRLAGHDLSADILKVGHHGSRTATGETFLGAVAPAIAAISCGRRNRFGHPHPEIIRRLERRGIRVCRTDLTGTFGVVLGPRATLLSTTCEAAPPQRSLRVRTDAR